MILSVCPNPSVDKFISLAELRKGSVNRSLGEQAYPGGKGTHVALAVSELGHESKLAGIWGGPTGKWIREECESYGVISVGPEVSNWTRTCLTIKTGSNNTDTEILEKGPEVTGQTMDNLFQSIKEEFVNADAISVSGSWPEGAQDNVYQILKELSDAGGVPLWVDASGNRLKQAIRVSPYGIHINRSEAISLFGPDKTPEYYTRELLNYCTLAAVTDGANGLFLAKDNRVIHANCEAEQIISTVGSGDCLLAGLMVSQASGSDIADMAKTGAACGTANCIHPGLGMLLKKDVDRLKNEVILEEL